jgi:hypothetical protein
MSQKGSKKYIFAINTQYERSYKWLTTFFSNAVKNIYDTCALQSTFLKQPEENQHLSTFLDT